MIELIAAIWLTFLIVAAVVLLVLLYTDHLPLPKLRREPTKFEKASQELADNMTEVQRQIGVALEPAARKMADALNELAKTFTKSGR